MDRLERLVNLLAALLNAERPLTREALRDRVPGFPDDEVAFRRAFERDKDVLRSMGIPLVMEPLDPDRPEIIGYRVPRDRYELPDPGLTSEELAAIHLAVSTVRIGSEATPTQALWKLGGAAGEVPSLPTLAALAGGDHLEALFAGLAERRTVAFGYRGGERRLDPWRIHYRNGHWYLTGWDHARQDERQFRVDRIDAAPTLVSDAGAFERPPVGGEPHPQPWELGDEEPVETLVHVDADQAAWAIEQAGAGHVHERKPDGSVVLALQVRSVPALRSWVFGLLDHAVVLGPPAVRADLVAWLSDMAGAAP